MTYLNAIGSPIVFQKKDSMLGESQRKLDRPGQYRNIRILYP